MSVLGFRNADNLFSLLGDALRPTPHRTTGGPGLFRTLPDGWAEVAVWPLQGADEHGAVVEHWSGPVLADTDTRITLDIGSEPMTWLKSDRITVKYGTGAAA